MSLAKIDGFRKYIEISTSSLCTALDRALDYEDPEYDIVYESFLKIVENFKINIIAQLKMHIFPNRISPESQKDLGILYQMKSLFNVKMKKYINYELS